MKKAFRGSSFAMMLVCAWLVPCRLHAGPKSEQTPPINVRTFVYAHVSPSKLAQAKRLAAHILDGAGIKTFWVDCHTMTDAAQSAVTCDRPPGPTISDVNILLVDQLPMGAKITGARTLGFAILPNEGGFADLAYVSLPNIETNCHEQKAPLDLVLGLVLAHEIGHLLLGLNEHTSTGIMRAHWDEADLMRAQVGELQFTDQQAKLLRTGVRARESMSRVAAVSSQS